MVYVHNLSNDLQKPHKSFHAPMFCHIVMALYKQE